VAEYNQFVAVVEKEKERGERMSIVLTMTI